MRLHQMNKVALDIMITIRYFGILREQLNISTEEFPWTAEMTTDDLMTVLRQRGPLWLAALAPEHIFRLVVNHEIIYAPVRISDGDEIAMLPPVTGG